MLAEVLARPQQPRSERVQNRRARPAPARGRVRAHHPANTPLQNVQLASVGVLEAFESFESLSSATRLLVESDLALFDVTGFEPGVMLLLGIRAATRARRHDREPRRRLARGATARPSFQPFGPLAVLTQQRRPKSPPALLHGSSGSQHEYASDWSSTPATRTISTFLYTTRCGGSDRRRTRGRRFHSRMKCSSSVHTTRATSRYGSSFASGYNRRSLSPACTTTVARLLDYGHAAARFPDSLRAHPPLCGVPRGLDLGQPVPRSLNLASACGEPLGRRADRGNEWLSRAD